jgi:hypothetical protein
VALSVELQLQGMCKIRPINARAKPDHRSTVARTCSLAQTPVVTSTSPGSRCSSVPRARAGVPAGPPTTMSQAAPPRNTAGHKHTVLLGVMLKGQLPSIKTEKLPECRQRAHSVGIIHQLICRCLIQIVETLYICKPQAKSTWTVYAPTGP